MSLVIGIQSKWVPWKEAGIELLIAPLSPAKRQSLEMESRVLEHDAAGKPISSRRDIAKYQLSLGRECVRGWRGMEKDGKRGPGLVDANGGAIPYSPEASDALMTIGPAADFVVFHAESLALHLQQDIDDAGKG